MKVMKKSREEVILSRSTPHKRAQRFREMHRPNLIIDEFQPPCWLDGGEGKPDPKDIIVCKNGLVNIRTREKMNHTPNFFTFTALPIVFNKDAPEPTEWLNFLTEITAKRKSLADLLQ